MKVIYVDIDETICKRETSRDFGVVHDYSKAQPIQENIEKINKLWEEGHTIIIETARGCGSKINHYERTFDQLRSWGLKFTSLRTGVKFGGDLFIDDKGVNSEDFFNGCSKQTNKEDTFHSSEGLL